MESEDDFENFFKEYKYPLLAGLVGSVPLISGVISSGIIPATFGNNSPVDFAVPNQKSTSVNSITSSGFKVDVAGAVNNPGVYSLNSGARVEDAIAVAGGVTAKANQSYINQTLNVAQKISDGMKIYIPEKGQTSKEVAGAETTASNLININTALAGFFQN